jgi:hypothetical protein
VSLCGVVVLAAQVNQHLLMQEHLPLQIQEVVAAVLALVELLQQLQLEMAVLVLSLFVTHKLTRLLL